MTQFETELQNCVERVAQLEFPRRVRLMVSTRARVQIAWNYLMIYAKAHEAKIYRTLHEIHFKNKAIIELIAAEEALFAGKSMEYCHG